MIILFGFSCLLVVSWVILFVVFKRPESVSFLNRNQTEILKGYAILLVMWGHIGSYMGLNGVEFPSGVGVSIFIILSGYGMEKSFEKQGLKDYWKKRIIRVWLPFALCDTIFLLAEQRQVTFKSILMNYTFIKEIYPFIWYFRFVFVCYLLFWICGRLFSDQKTRIAALFIACAVWFIIRSTVFVDETPFLEPRQMFCFPVGILLAHAKATPKRSFVYSLISIFASVIIYGVIHLPALEYEHISVIAYNFLLYLPVLCVHWGSYFLSTAFLYFKIGV